MGLTIHYTLTAPPGTDAARAAEWVGRLRRRALGFRQRDRVDAVQAVGTDARTLRWAEQWLRITSRVRPGTEHWEPVLPVEGFLFRVLVGEGCEPLWLGLCRYPPTVLAGGRLQRTGLRGWRLRGFCKTQYAGLHGWEAFQRCHTAVIDLLSGAGRLGLELLINDEAGYWPGRDLAALRRNLNEMNAAVAALAGTLKDACGDRAVSGVESPVLGHPQFERWEAEGVAGGVAQGVRRWGG